VSAEARLFYGFAATVMVVALITSLSRGGMISVAASALFLLVMRARLKKQEVPSRPVRGAAWLQRAAVAVAILVAVGVAVLWIDADAVINRVTKGGLTASDPRTETFFQSRGWIWQDTVAMIAANPILGVGIGAYQTAHPIYSRLDRSLIVGYAHNDYLQVLADCGIVGGAIALWFLVVVWRAIASSIKAHDALLRWQALGASAGIFALLVHSLFDFNLQIPANALLFLLLLAIVSSIGAGVAETDADEKVNSLGAPELRMAAWERGQDVRAGNRALFSQEG
jgi:O-antigen ligase